MADNDQRNRQQSYEQGLEVVQSEHYRHPVPQVHVHESHNYAYLVHAHSHHEGWQPVSKGASSEEKEVPSENPVEKKNRKTVWIIAAAFVCVAVIGAVVGGVVGSKAKSPSSPPESDQEVSPAAMTATPTSVAPGLAPTALSWGYPHLEVYALTTNKTHSVYWKRRNSTASSEGDFTPPDREMKLYDGAAVDATQSPSIGLAWRRAMNFQSLVNRTEVHVLNSGSKHIASHSYHNNDQAVRSWSAFDSFDFLSAPSLVQYAKDEDMIKTFGVGIREGKSAVYYFRWSQGFPWQGPIPIRGEDNQALHPWATPAVVAWAGNDSRLDVFAVSSTNNHVLHSYKEAETDAWSPYTDLRGFATTPPTVVAPAPGRLDVFVRGGDGGLWHRSLPEGGDDGSDGKGFRWARLGGTTPIRGQPAAVSTGPDSLDVFALGDNGALLHQTWDGAARTWAADNFTVLVPAGLVGRPGALAQGPDVHVFVYDQDNQIQWLTIGPDKRVKSEPAVWAHVPYPVE